MVEHLHFYPNHEKILSFRPRVVFSGILKGDIDWFNSFHRHTFCEVMYITAGSGVIFIGDDQYRIKAGDIVIYNTGILHEERCLGEELSILFFAVDNIRIPGMPEGCIVPSGASPVIESGSYDDVLKVFLSVMVDELNQKNIHYKAISTNIATVICHYILRLYGVEVKNPDHLEICNKFYLYVEQNYKSDINLDTFSDSIYISKYHFIHMFKEATGISPMKYLMLIRLSAARDLLGRTEMPIREIAESIGYKDAQSFSRAFKNNEGVSPTEYRESISDTPYLHSNNCL